MGRSPSNKGITNRNANLPPAARNTQNNTIGMIPGLTKGVTYGEGQDIATQVEVTGGLPSVEALPQTQVPMPKLDLSQTIDRATEREQESIMAGATSLKPGNYTVADAQNFPIARPGTEYKDSDMVSAYVQSGFNDDILNILLRIT